MLGIDPVLFVDRQLWIDHWDDKAVDSVLGIFQDPSIVCGKFIEPFIAAVMPLVPEASLGILGVFNQTKLEP